MKKYTETFFTHLICPFFQLGVRKVDYGITSVIRKNTGMGRGGDSIRLSDGETINDFVRDRNYRQKTIIKESLNYPLIQYVSNVFKRQANNVKQFVENSVSIEIDYQGFLMVVRIGSVLVWY